MNSFAQFYNRIHKGIPLVSKEENMLEKEETEMKELIYRQIKRRNELFRNSIPLLWKNRNLITNTPIYGNVLINFLSMFGSYSFAYSRGISILSLDFPNRGSFFATHKPFCLKTMFKIWEHKSFQVKCDCGNAALVFYAAGSPLSGSKIVNAYCPYCEKKLRSHTTIQDLSFLNLVKLFREIKNCTESIQSSSFSFEKMVHNLHLKEIV